MSIPLLRQFKKLYREDDLVLICRPGLASFFLQNKIVDKVIEIDKKKSQSIDNMYQQLASMQIRHWVCAHESVRSALITRKIKAENKIGYSKWWNASFFNIRVERHLQLPEALRQLHLLAPIDKTLNERLEHIRADKKYHNEKIRHRIEQWPHPIAQDLSLYVEPRAELARSALLKLRLQRPFAVVAPSSQWATKRWVDEGFVRLCQLLAERGLNVYLVGSKAETEHCHTIEKAAAQHAERVEVRSLAGQTDLLSLHALMALAEVVVANDSGPMHMATAAGRPVVALFGPTTLDLGYRPWSDLSAVVQIDLPCRPCGKHGHNKCPIGTHDCMKKITPQQVIQAVDHLRKRAHQAGMSAGFTLWQND